MSVQMVQYTIQYLITEMEWYRLVNTILKCMTSNKLEFGFYMAESGNGIYGNYPSVGLERFYLLTDSNLKMGSYPTSYIPTYGTSASRAVDDSRNGNASSDLRW